MWMYPFGLHPVVVMMVMATMTIQSSEEVWGVIRGGAKEGTRPWSDLVSYPSLHSGLFSVSVALTPWSSCPTSVGQLMSARM